MSKLTDLRIVNRKTREVIGYVVGKTQDETGKRFLVLVKNERDKRGNLKSKTFLFECSPENDAVSEIQAVEVRVA